MCNTAKFILRQSLFEVKVPGRYWRLTLHVKTELRRDQFSPISLWRFFFYSPIKVTNWCHFKLFTGYFSSGWDWAVEAVGRVGPASLDVIAQLQQSGKRLVTISPLTVNHTICAFVLWLTFATCRLPEQRHTRTKRQWRHVQRGWVGVQVCCPRSWAGFAVSEHSWRRPTVASPCGRGS